MTDGERETYMDAAARIAGLTIPDPCRAGVLAQLALFLPARAHPAQHPSILLAFEASAAAAAEASQLAPTG